MNNTTTATATKNFKMGITHAGVFHADDVFASAFLRILNPEIEIKRVFKAPEEEIDGIIFDIGLGEFDHHQKEREFRENGIPYAAFGKLWRSFGDQTGLSRDSLNKIEKALVEPIDATDNGAAPNPLSTLIKGMNPAWDSTESADEAFSKAVKIAKEMLESLIEKHRSVERAETIIDDAASSAEDGILTLEKYVPVDRIQVHPQIMFVVYPSNRGGWNVQTVAATPTDENPMAKRCYFPIEWLGNPQSDLGMTFCHPGNFLAVANTKEEAINIAKIAIERSEV